MNSSLLQIINTFLRPIALKKLQLWIHSLKKNKKNNLSTNHEQLHTHVKPGIFKCYHWKGSLSTIQHHNWETAFTFFIDTDFNEKVSDLVARYCIRHCYFIQTWIMGGASLNPILSIRITLCRSVMTNLWIWKWHLTPQGSLLEPPLFSVYILPKRKHKNISDH